MVKGILADNNIQGHVAILRQVWEGPAWRDVADELGRAVFTFADVSLAADAPDSAVWKLCQQQEMLLLTANRNDEGPESPESTIRHQNTPSSLPVITLANPERVRLSKAYATRTAAKVLEVLMDVEHYRGAGRVFAP